MTDATGPGVVMDSPAIADALSSGKSTGRLWETDPRKTKRIEEAAG
jgi:hypothetical protein